MALTEKQKKKLLIITSQDFFETHQAALDKILKDHHPKTRMMGVEITWSYKDGNFRADDVQLYDDVPDEEKGINND